jgi:putative peptide zinc metalloprotease protein
VEITWFVALPIVSEVKQWIRRRQAIRHSPKLPWLGLALLALVALICVPLPQRVRLPGQLAAQQEFSIVTPEAGQLTSFALRDGQTVPAGTPLLQIHSSAVQLRLAKARSREASLTSELLTAESTPQYRARVPILQAELSAARAARRDAELAARELEPKAPFAGTFRIHDIELHEGEHVGKNEEIAVLVGSGPGTVVAYLDEQESHLVREGASARIYLDGPDGHAMPLKVVSIERDASRVLAHPMLTTAAGGAIQARGTENGWVPEHSIYRVELAPVEGSLKTAAQVRRGTVVIAAGSEAIITRWAKNALSVLWRELGV